MSVGSLLLCHPCMLGEPFLSASKEHYVSSDACELIFTWWMEWMGRGIAAPAAARLRKWAATSWAFHHKTKCQSAPVDHFHQNEASCWEFHAHFLFIWYIFILLWLSFIMWHTLFLLKKCDFNKFNATKYMFCKEHDWKSIKFFFFLQITNICMSTNTSCFKFKCIYVYKCSQVLTWNLNWALWKPRNKPWLCRGTQSKVEFQGVLYE